MEREKSNYRKTIFLENNRFFLPEGVGISSDIPTFFYVLKK